MISFLYWEHSYLGEPGSRTNAYVDADGALAKSLTSPRW